jgi:hypothetical protein
VAVAAAIGLPAHPVHSHSEPTPPLLHPLQKYKVRE